MEALHRACLRRSACTVVAPENAHADSLAVEVPVGFQVRKAWLRSADLCWGLKMFAGISLQCCGSWKLCCELKLSAGIGDLCRDGQICAGMWKPLLGCGDLCGKLEISADLLSPNGLESGVWRSQASKSVFSVCMCCQQHLRGCVLRPRAAYGLAIWCGFTVVKFPSDALRF